MRMMHDAENTKNTKNKAAKIIDEGGLVATVIMMEKPIAITQSYIFIRFNPSKAFLFGEQSAADINEKNRTSDRKVLSDPLMYFKIRK